MPGKLLAVLFLLAIQAWSVGFACAVRAAALDQDLRQMLATRSADEEIPVIIRFNDGLEQLLAIAEDLPASEMIRTLRANTEISQKQVRALLQGMGVKQMTVLWIINGLSLTARADLISVLAGFSEVEAIGLDSTIRVPVTTVGAPAAAEWNIALTGAPDVWALGYRGQGVVVATMDTGVDAQHQDLAGRWRGGSNSWLDPNLEHAAPYDADGHGTQVMGLLLGGDAGGSSIGMAPAAQWIAVKIFNDAGEASYAAIHQGFQWLLDPDGNPATDDAPAVVNNSWGLDGASQINQCVTEFEEDIQFLKAAGIGVVFAAGNSGPDSATSVSPANYADSLAVGAVSESLNIALSSSRGPSACDQGIYPELVAPGVNVRTADLTAGGVIPDAYTTVSGTSFAAPHAAGAMALLRCAFPGQTAANLERVLMDTARDLGGTGPDNDYGYGLVNVKDAFSRIVGKGSLPPVLLLLLLSD